MFKQNFKILMFLGSRQVEREIKLVSVTLMFLGSRQDFGQDCVCLFHLDVLSLNMITTSC